VKRKEELKDLTHEELLKYVENLTDIMATSKQKLLLMVLQLIVMEQWVNY